MVVDFRSENFEDNTRYCLVRLVLRKANYWHPISTLEAYKKEVTAAGLEAAIADLCLPINVLLKEEPTGVVIKTEPDIAVKKEDGPETIDLTMDSDDEDMKPNIIASPLTPAVFNDYWSQKAGPSKPTPEDSIQAALQSDPSIMHLDYFCQDESNMTTLEILERLVKEKLLLLAKQMKCTVKPSAKVRILGWDRFDAYVLVERGDHLRPSKSSYHSSSPLFRSSCKQE